MDWRHRGQASSRHPRGGGGACRGRDCVGSPYQREPRHVGAVPAIHRLVANLALGIAALPKGETGHDQPILRAAMRTFVDRHWYVPVRRTSWPQRHESPMRPVRGFSESTGWPRTRTRTPIHCWSRPGPSSRQGLLLRSGNEALALSLLARELAGAAHRLSLLARRPLGRFFVEPPLLHLPEDALALHLLFQRRRAWSTLLSRTRTCKECSLHWLA